MTELSQLLACTHDALVATDKDFAVTFWNDKAEGLFGLPENEAKGRRIEDIAKIADTSLYSESDFLWEKCKTLLSKQGTYIKEVSYIHPNGQLIHANVHARAISNKNNKFNGAVFSFLDITKTKKTEESLRTCINCYQSMFDMIYEGFCILEIIRDGQGKPYDINILGANLAYDKLTGKTTGDLMNCLLEYPLDYYLNLYVTLDLKNGPARFEYRARKLNRYYDICVYSIDNTEKDIVGVLFQDITERKQSAKLISQYSERLAAAVDAAHMAYWDWDPAIDKAVVSDTASGIFGLMPGETLSSSNDSLRLIHPDDKDRYKALVQHAVAVGEDWHCEYRIIRPRDGRLAWLEERASSKKDPETGEIHQSGIVWDITDRKQDELALLQAKEQSEHDRKKLEAILEVMPSAVLLIDAKSRTIYYMNRRAIELYGCHYEGRELKAHIDKLKIRRLDGKPYPFEEMPIYHTLEFGREVRNREMLVQRADGSQLPIVTSSAPLYDSEGNIKTAIVIFDDITERKRTESALKESENRYHSLFRSMDEALCVMELIYDCDQNPVDFRFIDVNPAFEKLSGLKNSVGNLISKVYHGFDEHWLEALGKVARTGEPMQCVKELVEFNRWYSFNAFKVTAKGAEAVAVLVNDVTQDMKSRNEMKELIKIQDEVFANVSHELKTPLSVIFSTIQLLELYMRKDSLDVNRYSIYKSVRTIKQNCYRFTKLINNIVDLSKIDSGFFKLDLSNENIVDIVENIVQSIAEYIKGKGLHVVFDTDVEEKIIACDPVKIERIMLNLISNAIKFSNPKGTISVFVSDLENEVEIAVKDTGMGIEEKYLDAIFERFNQVDKTLTRNAEGSGIGLSLVKSIVDLHGGRITVESEVGNGSTFRIYLPVGLVEQSERATQNIQSLNKVELINIEFSDIYHL